MVLKRTRKGVQWLIVPIAFGGYFGALSSTFDAPPMVRWLITGLTFLIPFVLVIKAMRKPAAWIEGETLNIRGGFSSTTQIRRSDIESMRYEAGIVTARKGMVRDALYVKLTGFEEWEIPITDYVDHRKDSRLYDFINGNFYELPYQKHAVQ